MHCMSGMKTQRSEQELIAHYKRLDRRLADESLSEREAQATREEMRQVRAEIDAQTNDSMSYEAAKIERAKLDVEYTIADRHYRSQNPGSPEWKAARLACVAIERKLRAIVFGFLSNPETRHGDWRQPVDREIMMLIGWAGYRDNCAYAVR